jgi:hypothetical protein
MEKKKNKWLLNMFPGFGIAFISAIFILLIISLILSLLESLPLPRNLVVIYSTMFYAIFFFIARSGAGIKKRHWQPNLYEEPCKEDKISALSKKRSLISRVGSIAYFLSGIFAVMLLTPALVIYWISPMHPSRLIMLSAFILSLITATIYFIKNEEKYLSRADRMIFYMGACLGSIIGCYLYLGITSIIK